MNRLKVCIGQILFCLLVGCVGSASGAKVQEGMEEVCRLDFAECVRRALDNSLEMKAAEARKRTAEWRYKAYRAGRKPQLIFEATPLQYNSTFVSRYDYTNDREVYRNQKTLYSYGGLTLSQPVFWTGGTFFLRSDLNYVHNMGVSNYAQFSSVPLQLGYSQDLGGVNSWKWIRKIEELNWEMEQKRYRYMQEDLVRQVAEAFFSLYAEQLLQESAEVELGITDTLFREGKEKGRIGAIREEDLAVLEMDWIGATNEWEEACARFEAAEREMNRFLGREGDVRVEVFSVPEIKRVEWKEDLCVRAAWNNQADLLEQRVQELELERDLQEAKRKRFWEGSISASVGFNQVAGNFSGVYRDLLRGELATVSLTIPLVDWGKRKAQAKAAEYSLKNAEYVRQNAEQALELHIRELLAQIESRFTAVSRNRRALEIGRKAYRSCLSRYRHGLETAANLSVMRNRFRSVEQDCVRAQQEYWSAFYELRAITLLPF